MYVYGNPATITLLVLMFGICAFTGAFGSSKSFEIITNYKVVEEKVLRYVKSIGTFKNKRKCCLTFTMKMKLFLEFNICTPASAEN